MTNRRKPAFVATAMALLGINALADDRFANVADSVPYPRLPLELRIPITKNHGTTLKLWDADGRCRLKVGTLPDIDTELEAPCDITTTGPSSGFAPWVKFGSANHSPSDVTFEVVGALKFYPRPRAECGKSWRAVTIRFDSGSGKAQPTLPHVELSQVVQSERANGTIRCPRSYVETK